MSWHQRIHALERSVDRAIGVLFPGIEARRIDARLRADVLRQYAAAKTSRSTGAWAPATGDVNSLIRMSNPVVRNRTRQLVRDFAFFARAVDVLVDHTVGTGIVFQSRVSKGTDKRGKAKLHKTAINKIEYVVRRWMDEADTSGKLHYYDLERLWRRHDVECGEALGVFVVDRSPGRFLPLSIQMYEPDWLNSDFSAATGNNLVDQGIEFDRATGKPVSYHFTVPDGFNQLSSLSKTVVVPAADVIHGFELDRPGQLRGISPFTPAILLADSLQELINANLDRSKMAAKWLAFVETADAAQWMRGRTQSDPGSSQNVTVLENAIIDFLKPGDKVNFNTADIPGEAFSPFARFILQMVAVSVGLPYYILSGDAQGLNYNVTRTLRNDFAKAMRPQINRHIRQYSQPVIRRVIDMAVLTGQLSLPGYEKNPWPWLECLWQPNGSEPLDLLRESRGHIDLVDNLLFSPQEIITARGRDPEDVLNEIAEFNEAMAERDLAKAKTSKATQTNPAAVANNATNTEAGQPPAPEETP